MSKDRPTDLSKLLGKIFVQFMDKNRHQSALMTGVLGYVASQEANDAELEDMSKAYMVMAVEHLRPPEASGPKEEPECSFCGRGKPEVKLVAGARAFICNECVALVTHILKHEARSARKKNTRSRRAKPRGRRKPSN